MVARNKLQTAPPYPVEQALRRLGANLAHRRIRRSLTIADAAERIGTGPRAIMDAEKGKPSTGIVVYAGLLWLYDLLQQVEHLGDPPRHGRTFAASRERAKACSQRRVSTMISKPSADCFVT